MKKNLSLFVVGVLVAALFGACSPKSNSGQTSQSESAQTVAPKVYRIGFANASISNSWRVKMRDMLLEEVARRGNIQLIETDAQDDASRMNANIESMLQQNLDAILITPVVEDAVNPGIEMAFASGIPVIIFDRHCSTEDFTHFVGYSDRQNGVETAKLMVEALTKKYGEPKGDLVAFDSIAGSSTDRLIKEGWDEVFSQYPNVNIIARQYTDFEVSRGKSFMEDCLTRFAPGRIDGFVSQDGGVTLGAFDAIDEAGRGGEGLLCTNADGINGVARLVKEGRIYGFTQFPCKASVDALGVAIDVLEGRGPSTKEVMMDSIIVTTENADEYFIPGGDDYDWTL
jgi:ABC-type sugar transport system substrate-binding protein